MTPLLLSLPSLSQRLGETLLGWWRRVPVSSPGVGARRAAVLAAMLARGGSWRRYVEARREDLRVLEDLWLVEDGVLTPLGILVSMKSFFPDGLGYVLAGKRLEEYDGVVRGVSVYAAFLASMDRLLDAIRRLNEGGVFEYQGNGWRLVMLSGERPRVYARGWLLRRELEAIYSMRRGRWRIARALAANDPETFYVLAARLGLVFHATRTTGVFIRECRRVMRGRGACQEWPFATIIDDLIDADVTLGELFDEELDPAVSPATYAALAVATELTDPLIEAAVDAGLAAGLLATIYDSYSSVMSPFLVELARRELRIAVSLASGEVIDTPR